jgi:hypothetical protein
MLGASATIRAQHNINDNTAFVNYARSIIPDNTLVYHFCAISSSRLRS